MPAGRTQRFVVSSRTNPRMRYLGPVLRTDGCPGCQHGGSAREAKLCLLAPSFMSHFAGLDEKKALHHQLFGLDHGVGHSLLLLYDAKAPRGQKSKKFNDLGHDPSNASISLFYTMTKY